MSWFSSKCYDFSFVKITMKDLIKASRSSLFAFAYSDWLLVGIIDRPEFTTTPLIDSDWSPM